MSAIAFFVIVIISCVILSALMLGLVFVTESTRDLGPFFQAAVALVIVFFSVFGLRHARWAMEHHTVVQPAYTWQYSRAWMYPGQAMIAFGGTVCSEC
jgi:hypothetical protein